MIYLKPASSKGLINLSEKVESLVKGIIEEGYVVYGIEFLLDNERALPYRAVILYKEAD